jgi:hypothetical protein
MTPIISLLLVGGLVIGVTMGRRNLWERPPRGADLPNWRWIWLSLHLGWCLVCAGAVWLLNWALWPNWLEGFAVFGLLCLVGVLAGLLSWLVICRPFQRQLPPQKSVVNFQDNGGIIRYQKAVHARGQLPPGIELHWNEQRRRWSSLEAVKEEE